jgi:amidase
MGQVPIDSEAVKATRVVADKLANLGHKVSDGYPPAFKNGMWPMQWFGCVSAVISREVDWLGKQIGRPLTPDDVHPAIWAYSEQGKRLTAIEYAAGVDSLRAYARDIERWWVDDGWDILLTPTIPVPTPRIGELNATSDNPSASVAMWILQYTVVFNMTGLPAVSLPLYQRSDGMPQGVQLGAAYGREDLLIRVASQLEEAMPWRDRKPPIFAR